MGILNDLLSSCQDGKLHQVCIGLHWTAVVVDVAGEIRCGLASTVLDTQEHTAHGDISQAGQLEQMPARELAEYIHSEASIYRSLGMATINALLPRYPQFWSNGNADQVIAEHGKDKKVVIVGNFPFVPNIRKIAREVIILEQTPKEGEHPAVDAPQLIPDADVVAITGMALVNHTLDGLLKLCSPNTTILVLGPSTPLVPLMFDYGIRFLSGSVVMEVEPVLRAIMQGACFRQIKHFGVRLVTMNEGNE